MAPSRGNTSAPPSSPSPDDKAVTQQSDSALKNARRNFNFLINPSSATDKPARFRTRALLRTFRYLGQFIIWRLVRWAKYAAIAAIVGTLGATAFGGLVSGVGFVVAPTGILGSVVAMSVWGVGKYIARRAHARWVRTGGDAGEVARERVEDAGETRQRRVLSDGVEMGPRAVPW